MIKSDSSIPLEDRYYFTVLRLIEAGLIKIEDGECDALDIADALHKMHLEKAEKEMYSDSLIDYNDEIVGIEEMGEMETMDISVTGDNLFYCQGILTKNSFGINGIADAIMAIINSEELVKSNQIMIKQLKNRYRDLNMDNKFLLGIDRTRMRIYDLDDSGPLNTQTSRNAKPTATDFDEFNFG